jgi:hypothetical protein
VVGRLEVHHLGGVDLGPCRVLVDRIVDGGLEAPLEHDDVRFDDPRSLLERDLQVVGFAARLREVRDGRAVTGDALGDVLQRIEGSNRVHGP